MFKVSEVELKYRCKIPAEQRPKICSSKDCYNVLKTLWDSDTIEMCEEFKILFLNKGNKVIGVYNLSKGGLSGTVVDLKLVFAATVKALASGIIIAHNHPSGSLQPSQADIDITRRIKKAGELLDIAVLDHLIISPDDTYYSFADEGMI
jgi:DNA repair protein RadC